MAEFTEVMKQFGRWLKAGIFDSTSVVHTKDGRVKIALYINRRGEACVHLGDCNVDPTVFEEDIMKWAAEHPEPKLVYPTWEEWFAKAYPNGQLTAFCPRIVCGTFACITQTSCKDCMEQRIPEHIAKELGIKLRRENEQD